MLHVQTIPTPIAPAGPVRAGGHWHELARRWSLTGPPLRPSPEDCAVATEAIHAWAVLNKSPSRGLILGVTPELYHLNWPKGADVRAVDHTQHMIDAVWPGPRRSATLGEWTDLPLEAASRDIALCDGGVAMLRYPDQHRQLAASLQRVLAPGGLCVFRLYVRPQEQETPEAVLHDLLAGRIANVNLLKLRLCMAMQEDPKQGVQLSDVWNAFNRVASDRVRIAARIGWQLESLQTIESYRDCAIRYTFLTVAEVCSVFCDSPGGFTFEAMRTPAYELGERCPSILLRR